MISISKVHSEQTVHLSCAEAKSLKTDQNKLPLNIHYLGVPSGVPKLISMLVAHLVQTVHLSCAEINTICKRIEMSFLLTNIS